MARGTWAADVRSLDTGEVLYQRSHDKLMMPASNMKIVTLAAAAEILGWDHRLTTTLETSAPVEDGVLRGDLFVRGRGDPTINAREGRASLVFAEWERALRAAGITSIDGRIIGDDQAFDDEGLGGGWSWDYLQYGYAAPVGALQLNENLAQLAVHPAAREGDPALVMLSPGSGLHVFNRAVTGAADGSSTIDFRRRLDRPVLEVTGSIPLGSHGTLRPVAVVNPTRFFVQSLKDDLCARGIIVTGKAVDMDDVAAEFVAAPPRRVLSEVASPPLKDIASTLMKVSQNNYAETLIKAIGAARSGLGTSEGGRQAVREVLTTWGIPRDAYVIADGSGLSRYNYVSAEAIVTILQRMHEIGRHREAFAATLPIAGRDGTIASRMRKTRAEGNAIAKTGSIANVRTLSGYVRTRDGELLAFSILANDFVIPAATVNWISDLAVEILANFSRGAVAHRRSGGKEISGEITGDKDFRRPGKDLQETRRPRDRRIVPFKENSPAR